MALDALGVSAGPQSELLWLARADLEAAPPPVGRAIALVCDLEDSEWTTLQELPPSAEDLADERRPGASARLYFQRRRALLRSLLAWRSRSQAQRARVAYDAAGAPRVIEPSAFFVSVAGRGSLAALTIARAPAGIDLEPMDGSNDPVWEVLAPSERAALRAIGSAADRSRAFLRLWTMKEAYLKAIGQGFAREPSTIAVEQLDVWRARVRDGEAATEAAIAEWRAFASLRALAACVVLPPRS